MKKTCINCKYKDIDYNEYPCCECNNKSRWEQWQDTNYQPTMEDLIIKELEQLKADIKEASYDRLDGFNGGQMVVDWEDIEDMFYDHISKLKGEYNE